MVFWKDNTGLPKSYRGWDVFVDDEQNYTKIGLADSTKKLLEWLQDYMSVDTVTLLLPTDRQNLAVYATLGLEEEIEQQIRIPIGQGIAGHIAASMEPMIVNDLSQVEIFSPILRQKDLQSLVGIPLPLKQGAVGVLHVGTSQFRQFSEQDLQQLQLVAHRITAMMNAFNFEWDNHNQERCLEVFGFRIHTSCVKTLHRIFTLNLFALGAEVLTRAGFAKNWDGLVGQRYTLRLQIV
ncbi:MAG: GAF domain-containing protein [Iphinoe sp. HA4291-MV1]|jgi:transcriptional regulator with GAF, ATPase, and Fis domain|nr:GAF domain-containing protein [Iphinoe sp. HA4291-MV1]